MSNVDQSSVSLGLSTRRRFMARRLARPLVLAAISASLLPVAAYGQAPSGKLASAVHSALSLRPRPPQSEAQSQTKAPKRTQPTTTLQTVVVTGTRVDTRTAVASLSPIDILSTQELRDTGAPTLTLALRTLLPSFNFPTQSPADATAASMPAQLRGLSPNETLVLINGKRQHTTAIVNTNNVIGRGSSPVDLGSIPINAVERIEVLRGGAAAQYGSSAIAGVINIILKKGARHGGAFVSFGRHNQSDATQGNTWTGGADGGFWLGPKHAGWVHLTANYTDQGSLNTAGPDRRFPQDPTFGQVTFPDRGQPAVIQNQAGINAQYKFGENVTAYLFGVYNNRNVWGGANFRSLSQYAQTTPAAVIAHPEGFAPQERSSLRDDNTVLGVRGNLLGWNYDLSLDSGGNHWKLRVNNSFNYSLGAGSPTSFYIGTLLNRENVFNADFNKNFDVGFFGPLNVAWGLAYDHQKFQIKHGDAASYFGGGSQGFGGFTPANAGTHTRTDWAEYIDLDADVTEALSLDAAARHEHYSDFGNATVWKLSGRYAFTPTVALRGTVATGFAAPTLQQKFFAQTSNSAVRDPVTGQVSLATVNLFPVSSPVAQALGAVPLTPEKAHNYSVGLVLTPSVGPYVTIDAYQIRINNRIILSGFLLGPNVASFLAANGFTGIQGGRFFTNAATTRTRGADLVASWPIELTASTLMLTAGANYNKTKILSVKPNPPQLGLNGLTLPVLGREVSGFLTVTPPRTKAFVGATWKRQAWTVTGRVVRYGTFEFRSTAPIGDQTYGARMVADASVAYTFGSVTVTLGGNNIFNTRPERNNAINDFQGIDPYPDFSPFGRTGPFWYARVNYSW